MASLKYAVDIDTRRARGELNALEGSIGRLGGLVAGAFAVREIVSFGDELIGLRNKLAAFSSSQAEANAKFDQIAAIAGRARSSLAETGDLYNKMAIASTQLGLSTQQVGQITETFAKSLKVGGANAQESASAILQFSQAMGSGVLRGEEFNAVFEASSSTMLEIAKAMGVPIGQMRKLAEEGKLTSDVVSRAILKMTDAVEEKFAKTIPTMSEAFANLRTAAGIAFTEMANETGTPAAGLAQLGQSLLQLTNDIPKLTAVIKDLVNILTYAGIAFVAFRGYALLANGGMATLLDGITSVVGGFTRLAGGARASIPAMLGISTEVGKIKNSLVGLGSAFGIFDSSRGKLMKMAGSLGTVGTAFTRIGQVVLSLTHILGNILRIGLRFAGWVFVFFAVVDVINLLYKAVTGSNEKLINLGSIFKGIVTVLRVVWGLIKALGEYIGGLFAPYVQKLANAWNSLMTAIMNTGPMKAAASMLDWVRSELSALWSLAKRISGVTAADQKAAMDKIMSVPISEVIGQWNADRAAVGKPGIGPKAPKPSGVGGGGGKGTGGGGRSQTEINRELKKSIEDVTKAYREQVGDRLEALRLDTRILGMSQDQQELERAKADILKNQRDTLQELDDKELEIRNNNELTAASRKKNLDLVAQQRIAVNTQAAEELAQTEKLIQQKQRFAIEQERLVKLTELQQQANEQAAAVKDIEDQLRLVGLYGDKLDEVTAQLELQQKIREIELEYTNQLLELDRKRAEIGEERYANELAHMQAIKSQAIGAATEEAAAQRKLDLARKNAERNDWKGAIGKKFDELEESYSKAAVAAQTFDAVWNNMSNALDNFVETGKLKFGDLTRSILADIAKIALKQAVSGIFSVIGKALFRAAGGPVMAGKPYVVGEQGPELFVPNTMGSIIPNHALNKNGAGSGANPVVNNITNITNNISAIDSRSVAQMFVENRKALLGAATIAQKERPYGS